MWWCCGLFLVRSSQGALALCDRQKRGIELDKRGVDCSMFAVAAIATGGGWGHLCGLAVVEAKECPVAWKTRTVLYVHLKPHDAGALIVASLVDGAFALSAANFKHEHRLVGPCSSLYESFVRLGIYKDIVEHVVVACLCRGAVAHVEPRGEVDPLPIVLG